MIDAASPRCVICGEIAGSKFGDALMPVKAALYKPAKLLIFSSVAGGDHAVGGA
jgi:hypothetical protein